LADLREASEALRTWAGIKLMDRYESGARAAQATLCHDQVFPYGLIGPVEVIWRPEEAHLTERTIWLRIHPSIYPEAISLLESLLAVPDGQSSEASTSTAPQRPAIRITDLRDQIDSFEIMGPKSARILRRILRLSKTEGKDKANVSYHTIVQQTADISSSLRV
jgi:ribonuclease P/MRP protein subunit POP1